MRQDEYELPILAALDELGRQRSDERGQKEDLERRLKDRFKRSRPCVRLPLDTEPSSRGRPI